MKSQDDIALEAMISEIENSDEIFRPSQFWSGLNRKNQRMLNLEGRDGFKRTISQNYFNWLIADKAHPFFRHAFRQWVRRPNIMPFATSLREADGLRLTTSNEKFKLKFLDRHVYRLYVCFVWTIMMKFDPQGLRFKLSEPAIGNPLPIKYIGQAISQDLATSIIESNVLGNIVKGIGEPKIAEIGAGYGRLAWTFLRAFPGKYFIFDIPPALSVAQWYLEQTLGKDHVFRFRPFDRFEDISSEIADASVAFFTPNQIKFFPDRYFDATVSVSTLPEMRVDQVVYYLNEMQRLSRCGIFLKQWKTWKNPEDGTNLTNDSYKFNSDWFLSMDRDDPVIPDFFNRVWSRTSTAKSD